MGEVGGGGGKLYKESKGSETFMGGPKNITNDVVPVFSSSARPKKN